MTMQNVFLCLGLMALTAAAGELRQMRTVSASELISLLSDKRIKRHEVTVVSESGDIITGRIRQASINGVELKGRPVVALCNVQRVRVAKRSAPWWRRAFGLVAGAGVGAMGGSVLGGVVVLAGADDLWAIPILVTVTAVGASTGYNSVAKDEITVYKVEPSPCS